VFEAEYLTGFVDNQQHLPVLVWANNAGVI
jgi:hypothetical protein